MTMPSQRVLAIVGITMVLVVAVMSLAAGLLMRASPRALLLIVLFDVGAGSVGVALGWLFLRLAYSDLWRAGEGPPLGEPAEARLGEVTPVEYELDSDDILSFFSYNYEQSPRRRMGRKLIGRVTALAVAAELLAAAIVLVGLGSKYRAFAVPLIGVAVLTSISYFVYPLITQKVVKVVVRRNYGRGGYRLAGKHRLSVSPQEVVDVSDMGESTTRWSGIEWVGSTDQHLFMMVRGSGPYILPKRAFPDEETFTQAVAAAKLYHQQAQGA